jgi:hypothetical protein
MRAQAQERESFSGCCETIMCISIFLLCKAVPRKRQAQFWPPAGQRELLYLEAMCQLLLMIVARHHSSRHWTAHWAGQQSTAIASKLDSIIISSPFCGAAPRLSRSAAMITTGRVGQCRRLRAAAPRLLGSVGRGLGCAMKVAQQGCPAVRACLLTPRLGSA